MILYCKSSWRERNSWIGHMVVDWKLDFFVSLRELCRVCHVHFQYSYIWSGTSRRKLLPYFDLSEHSWRVSQVKHGTLTLPSRPDFLYSLLFINLNSKSNSCFYRPCLYSIPISYIGQYVYVRVAVSFEAKHLSNPDWLNVRLTIIHRIHHSSHIKLDQILTLWK